MSMTLDVGDRVVHPARSEWGLGQIIQSADCKVTVVFEHAGEKTVRIDIIPLKKVVGEQAKSAFLDSLRKTKRKSKRALYSLDALIELFQREFPGGFHGEKFAIHERDYKQVGHRFAIVTLDEVKIKALLKDHRYEEVALRARRVIEKLNLPSQFEVMKLRSGMKGNEKRFAEGINDYLFGHDDFSERFERFTTILGEIGAAKWPIATYYPFMMFPAEHMFLKPEVTQAAADACGFELMYRPELNFVTYSKLLDFSKYLFDQLSDLNPRDMIDIQSFIWCVEKVSRGEY